MALKVRCLMLLQARSSKTDMKPAFRNNDYYGGLNTATDDLIKYTKGEYKADAKPANNDNNTGGGIFALIIIVVVILIFIFRNRGGGGTDHRRSWRRKPVLVVPCRRPLRRQWSWRRRLGRRQRWWIWRRRRRWRLRRFRRRQLRRRRRKRQLVNID